MAASEIPVRKIWIWLTDYIGSKDALAACAPQLMDNDKRLGDGEQQHPADQVSRGNRKLVLARTSSDDTALLTSLVRAGWSAKREDR